jgi:hypothetical protein
MDRYEALLAHAETLRRQMENHHRLLQEHAECICRDNLDFCPYLECPHEKQLRGAIRDVVETLEETRKAFKSKQLENLRKRMLDVLQSPPE